MFRLVTYLAPLLVLGWFGSPVQAQGVVPGGWSHEIGYQVLSGPGFSGAGMSFGSPGFASTYSMTGFGGMGPYGAAVNTGFPMTNQFQGTPSAPQTFNGTDPLISAIRHSTKRRKAR